MAILWTNKAILQNIAHSAHSVIQMGVQPLVVSTTDFKLGSVQNNFWLMFFLIIGISLVPTGAIVFIVKEREPNCKQQKFAAGVSLLSYLASNFVCE